MYLSVLSSSYLTFTAVTTAVCRFIRFIQCHVHFLTALYFLSVCSLTVTQAHVIFLTLRLLVDTVVHFPPSLEEVTVSVSDERMWVRNHVEEEAGDS